MDPLLATILLFGGNFNPRGWAFCYGSIISIAQNTALFSLLGTTYGGNGQTTFALPDLRGRAAIGWGNAPGIGNYDIGQVGGTISTTLTINNMPAHIHTADISQLTVSPSASSALATTNVPANGQVPAQLPTIGSGPGATVINAYGTKDNTVTLGSGVVGGSVTINPTGGTQPFSIQNPYLALSYIIAMEGVFPSRG
ncbi:MAG TPA: tail fiber protein [Chitinophaga sp.]|uniref:phage tail protein n=1 Tax=Chitinophaga sp. TaxID=1869181 RepID=UPI002B628554|nr:tail fiber protein [Chitinophaga sp.]HVI45059.1 tail fiber protein [Chitinophaga sp.]